MNRNFDEILDSFRDDQPTASQVEDAGARVRQQLFGNGVSATSEVSRITGCADFRTLLASYADGTLPEARRMLVQDHLRECGACRRALDETRGLRPKVVPFEVNRPKKASNFQKWAIAAGMFAAVGTSSWGILKYLLPGGSKGRNVASIQDVRGGALYKGTAPVAQGLELAEAESIRTPMGTRATVKLEDGSLIEVNERSEISISKGWSGTTIRLTSGNIIVQAAKQRSGKLMVSTPDALVSVKGTIFSVNRGVKGSRVSVVEGSVQVDPASGGSQMLKPGDQTTTDPSLAKVAIKDEVSWSENSARYLSLLGEFNALSQKIDAIPGPGLRYSSPLSRYVKPDTLVYVAIPNLGDTLAEAKKVFDRQLLESPSLRKSWEQATNEKSRAATDDIIREIQQFASYLGPEVVLMLDGAHKAPVALAEVKREGLTQFIEEKIAQHAKGSKPAGAVRGSIFEIHKNTLIFGKDAQELHNVMAAIDQGGVSTSSPFRDRIDQAYQSGAGWLFCANMEQIVRDRVQKTSGALDLGVDNAKYLILERKEVGGKTQNVASLTFSEQRHGVMAWLAEPSSLTSLDFVSPDAGLAFAAVTKRPRLVVEEMLTLAGSKKDDIAEMKEKTGIDPVEDLADALGSEFAFASDGPVLQSLSWKLAAEMNSPQKFQQSVDKFVTLFSKEHTKGRLKLETSEVDGRTFYAITAEGFPFAIHYTYVDNYLLAGANRALLVTAIKNRQNGYVLSRSEKFRSQLPYGASPNFSAIFYHNVAGALGPVAEQLKSTGYGTDEFRKGLDSVSSMAPGMVAIYGEPTRITAATHGDFFGLNAGMLAGLDKGGPGMLDMLNGAGKIGK
ncbi:MAG: FecR domain-containing protein [Acidobacteria bacterium]|nr:FecR domain-containing protein [Acidobacteriota bacterium]